MSTSGYISGVAVTVPSSCVAGSELRSAPELSDASDDAPDAAVVSAAADETSDDAGVSEVASVLPHPARSVPAAAAAVIMDKIFFPFILPPLPP